MRKLLLCTFVLYNSSLFSMSLEQRIEKLEKQNNELEEELTQLRVENIGSKFSFGSSLTNSYINMKYYDVPNDGDPDRISNLTMKYSLRMNAEVSKRLNFYSILGMAKYYNSYVRTNQDLESGALRDFGAGWDKEGGSKLFVERAYLNYDFEILPLSFSIGRLPTFDGPPSHYKDQQFRQGTYPMASYNQILDGVGLTYRVGDHFLPKNHNFEVRYLYTPLSYNNVGVEYKQVTHLDKNGNTVKTDSNRKMSTLMAEYQYRKSLIESFDVIFQHYDIDETFPPIASFNNTSLASLRTDYKNKQSNSTLYIAANNLVRDLNLSLSYSRSIVEVSGDTYCSQAGFGSPPNCNGNPIGTGNGIENGKVKGYAWLTSMNYKLPFRFKRNPVLGLEYLKSNDGYTLYNSTAEDLGFFYSTRGEAKHYYFSQKLLSNLNLRLGYTLQNINARVGSTSGKIVDKVSEKIETFYTTLKLDF